MRRETGVGATPLVSERLWSVPSAKAIGELSLAGVESVCCESAVAALIRGVSASWVDSMSSISKR